jgi:Pyridoxamine 5'-phosphate oxidase
MHRGAVYFRTLPDGLLAELAEPTSVALAVDELDQQTRSGWSIVLHGQSSAVRKPEELADLWASDSWCPGIRKPHPVHPHPSRPDCQAGSCDGRPDSRAYHLSRIEMGHRDR